jgi:lactoylglutathione lyase
MRADHVAFRVADIDAAIDFYTGSLGLRLLNRQVSREHGEALAFLDLDGCRLELIMLLDKNGGPVAYDPPSPTEPFCPHVAVAVGDVDAMLETIVKGGAQYLKGPMEIPDEVRWAYVADPDGNVIELVQWHKPAGAP